MPSFVAMKFSSTDGAESALDTITDLAKEHIIKVFDAAIVSWPEGKKKPKTRQHQDLTAAGALNGAFWGMLFGLIFFMPLVGAAIGAAMGALSGSMADVGISEDFIKSCRERITPGSSALFLMAKTDAADKVIEALKPHEPEIIKTNLSNEQEQALREAFEDEA